MSVQIKLSEGFKQKLDEKKRASVDESEEAQKAAQIRAEEKFRERQYKDTNLRLKTVIGNLEDVFKMFKGETK